MSGEEASSPPEEERGLAIGHDGAGSDCLGKAINFGAQGLIFGGVFGAVEGCFLNPVPGSTTPMVVRAIKLIFSRAALGATVGGVFATTACVSASIRDKDDYKNAFLGGAAAGSVFGLTTRRIPIGLMLAFGLGTACAVVKYRHGTYLPPLPSREPPPPEQPELSTDNASEE